MCIFEGVPKRKRLERLKHRKPQCGDWPQLIVIILILISILLILSIIIVIVIVIIVFTPY